MRLPAGFRAPMHWGCANRRVHREKRSAEAGTDSAATGLGSDPDEADSPRMPVLLAILVIAGLASLLWIGLIEFGSLLLYRR